MGQHFCKQHIVMAMASGISKSADGKVTISKNKEENCKWSGCGTPSDDLHLMEYEKGAEPTEKTPQEQAPQVA